MTKEELLNKTAQSMTMKELRKFVEENKNLDDNAPCLVQRVEDSYFRPREFNSQIIQGWDVLRVKGEHYYNALNWNTKMQKEIEFRKKGIYDYPNLKESLDLISTEEELESYKEQFYQPHCITTDKEIIYIYSHY